MDWQVNSVSDSFTTHIQQQWWRRESSRSAVRGGGEHPLLRNFSNLALKEM
jgi:hypothetical protein